MDKSASALGTQTLNALTFKLAVTQILTQVANDEFFFKFNDEIIPDILKDTFTDNHSIHESKCDTEEDVSSKVAKFLESGTEAEKQVKALEISRIVVERTAVSANEKSETLAKLEELEKRLQRQPAVDNEENVENEETVENDENEHVTQTVSAPTSPTRTKDFSAAETVDFQVLKSKSLPGAWHDVSSSLGRLVHEGEITTKKAVDVMSSSLPEKFQPTNTSEAEAKIPQKTKKKKKKKMTKRAWSPAHTLDPSDVIKLTGKPKPKHDWVGTLRSRSTHTKKMKSKTSQSALRKLIRSKMMSFRFVSTVSAEAERHRKKEEKRQQDADSVKSWLASKTKTKKKKKKKKPLFDLRSYSAKTGETNLHTLKLGGLRHPYDLQGVQFVPAERLGEWRNEANGRRWSSSFHTATFPLPPNRDQTHKLKNEATPRKALQPKLITFGEFGEVEWFTCLKGTDVYYQSHAENMTRLQLARKMLEAQKNNSSYM